ncbi:MAG: ATP phosphoribosyltransferase regulatory subunit [Rhodobacter sp.]|jgi:ATP phosphoribosyltransferase regulatory subunit|nr:ATP phosphoribosyltransferase regulatory subunit [Rhodobacter sp.]
MLNDRRARIRAEADRLSAYFLAQGALPVEAAALQPAETLLDLYGEDIRARAYVTFDPVLGEQMMRPDFTVPVVQMHMNEGAEPARYTYNGTVWRKQKPGSKRSSEYLQVGFELFDRSNPARSDAEVFALFADLLAPLKLRAATGDMGILMAAVTGLSTLPSRKAALKRHIWHPTRFRQLLDRFGGTSPIPASRAKLLAEVAETSAAKLVKSAGRHVGLRSPQDITDRVQSLVEDAIEAPISTGETAILEEILNLKDKSTRALAHLRTLAKDLPNLVRAVDLMDARLNALSARGINVDHLDFEGSYGRTSLEYYDGFVFGFYAENRPDLPVIASGGRYDALTEVLGHGRSIPAVGGVIRPEYVLAIAEGM